MGDSAALIPLTLSPVCKDDNVVLGSWCSNILASEVDFQHLSEVSCENRTQNQSRAIRGRVVIKTAVSHL